MPKEPEYVEGRHQLAFANRIHMWEYETGSGYKSAPVARVKRALHACHFVGRSHAENGLCRLWTWVRFLCLQIFASVVSMKMWWWNLTCPGSLSLSPSGLVMFRRIYSGVHVSYRFLWGSGGKTILHTLLSSVTDQRQALIAQSESTALLILSLVYVPGADTAAVNATDGLQGNRYCAT